MRTQGICFFVIGLIYQIAVLVLIGLLITYDRTLYNTNYNVSSFGMIAMLTVLLLVGNLLK